jgi:hypothetical protein
MKQKDQSEIQMHPMEQLTQAEASRAQVARIGALSSEGWQT